MHIYKENHHQRLKEEIIENLTEASISERLKLKDYLFAIACAIEPTQELNEVICDDVLGGQGEADGYRERAATSSESSSESDTCGSEQDDAFDVNFEMANIDMLLYSERNNIR